MRDHTKLRAFQRADALALLVYEITAAFPKAEQYGLTSQMRRAAVSVACNIVEGCARLTEADYVRFLDMAFGSAKELQCQITLAHRLGYMGAQAAEQLSAACDETAITLGALIRSYRRKPLSR